MYPNSTKCLFKETMGSYSKTVAGIAVLTLVITFGLAIMIVWDYNGNNHVDYNLPFIPENKFLEESSSGSYASEDLSKEILPSSEISEDIFSEEAILGSSDVPVPQGGCFCGYDTEAGKMEILNVNMPDPEVDLIPLCIDDTWLGQWGLEVYTLGGYAPVSGCIEVYQCKTGVSCWDCLPVGYIEVEFSTGTPVCDPCDPLHGYMKYDVTFKLPDGAHPIVLESNHIPDNIGSDFWIWDCCNDNLDKFVDFCVRTTWEGCCCLEQQFMVILAHKAMSQNIIPNSR